MDTLKSARDVTPLTVVGFGLRNWRSLWPLLLVQLALLPLNVFSPFLTRELTVMLHQVEPSWKGTQVFLLTLGLTAVPVL